MSFGWRPRQLPIRVRPVHDETVASYLARLARINYISQHDFLTELTGTTRPHAFRDPHRLSVITGYPPDTLTHALPELRATPPPYIRGRHGAAPACPLCTRGHPGGAVYRFYRPHHRVCLRHERWVGPGIRAAMPPPLQSVPDVLAAARRHRRLHHRRDPALVDTTFDQAEDIVFGWLDRKIWALPVPQHLNTLLGPGHGVLTTTQDAFHIALYPDVVTLTAILASPHWRRLAITPGTDTRGLFSAEVARRLNLPHHRFAWNDPLITWANTTQKTG